MIYGFCKFANVFIGFIMPLSQSIWESPELADQCTFQTLYSLVERCKRATTESCVVWERQRGYLREHLGDPFLSTAHKLGWPIKIMSPSEKYHRIGVSSNKQVCKLEG